MNLYRATAKEIRALRVDDKKTWPLDLQVWVELSTHRPGGPWHIPFYLTPNQIRALRQIIRQGVAKRAR